MTELYAVPDKKRLTEADPRLPSPFECWGRIIRDMCDGDMTLANSLFPQGPPPPKDAA